MNVPDSRPDRLFVAFVVGATLLTLVCLGQAGFSSRSFTCAACRAARTTRDWHGWAWADERADTECSRWYAAHVEPTHDHAWVALPYCRRFGIPGIYGGVGCFMGGGPIVHLVRSRQVEVYEHFTPPVAAKPIFLQMAQRGAEGSDLLDGLLGWSLAGYPGTWDEWRRAHPAAP